MGLLDEEHYIASNIIWHPSNAPFVAQGGRDQDTGVRRRTINPNNLFFHVAKLLQLRCFVLLQYVFAGFGSNACLCGAAKQRK